MSLIRIHFLITIITITTALKIFIAFFTFFYISRRKNWFRTNFRFPVFDGFTLFEMSWTRFDYFWKMSVCLCACVWPKFLSHTHRHTDRHFPEIVKSCSGHPKTCQSINNNGRTNFEDAGVLSLLKTFFFFFSKYFLSGNIKII